ncbi:hypothetical protein E3P84_03514 [Wallemia ichthyophaga]|nr:hypothetical protein E3P84_03514 [Wallemia ichthyophaga]TIB39502.1 hypothetical protein E3P83_03440 [Wallemia ichthyophaga]
MLFIQHLSGLIKGLRANKDDEDKFIQSTLQEIKNEIKSADIETKSVAVLKLSYLEMLGYDISWSAFPIIETASSSKLHLKSIGYLAASLSFSSQTDVMILMPNLLKKDLASEPSAALSCFSSVATPELSVDLSADLSRLSTHTRPAIRQKAVAAILVAIKQSNNLDLADFKKRLRERLHDDDAGVLSATVSAITELASLYPTQSLGFAPPLYDLLTSSNNNWMIIKILKLFAALLPHEQRLQKKLYAPLSDLIESTTAVSVLYECVLTCIVGGMLHKNQMAENCLEKLTKFLTDDDHNCELSILRHPHNISDEGKVKYVALLAIAQMIPTHAHLLHAHQDDLLSTLDDPDLTIRLQGLKVVSAIVTTENVEPVMNKLFEQLVPTRPDAAASLKDPRINGSGSGNTNTPSYTRKLAHTVLDICKRDQYTNIPSFAWLIDVVVQLAKVVPGVEMDGDTGRDATSKDDLATCLQSTFLEIPVTYPQTREYSVNISLSLLGEYVESSNGGSSGSSGSSSSSSSIGDGTDVGSSSSSGVMSSIKHAMLPAAVYILGEYAMFLDTPHAAVSNLAHLAHLHPFLTPRLSPCTVAIALTSLGKVYGIHAMLLANAWEEDAGNVKSAQMARLARAAIDAATPCQASNDVDVVERARLLVNLLSVVWGELRKSGSGEKATDGKESEESAMNEANESKENVNVNVKLDNEENTNVDHGDTVATASEAPRSLYLLSSIYFDKPGAVPLDKADMASNVDLDAPLIADLCDEVYTDDEHEKEENHKTTIQVTVDTAEENRRRRQRKAALRAERAENPYYIKSKDERGSQSEEEQEKYHYDVDSIPIVNFQHDEHDEHDNTKHSALFYPKNENKSSTSSRAHSLKSPPLPTSSSQSSLSTPHTPRTTRSPEPHALSSGTVNKVVKKKAKRNEKIH